MERYVSERLCMRMGRMTFYFFALDITIDGIHQRCVLCLFVSHKSTRTDGLSTRTDGLIGYFPTT